MVYSLQACLNSIIISWGLSENAIQIEGGEVMKIVTLRILVLKCRGKGVGY